MTRDALDYIRRSFISETVIKHRGRAESTRVQNVPYEAIEEAVVNAVYHRGYDVREPVEVRVMHDELVVLSYPGPDRSVRLEQLRTGRAQPRRYRNRRIGEFLKELEFTEGRGTGIPKIIGAMRQNGSPAAAFEFDEDHSYFMTRLPVHPAALEVVESEPTGTDQVTPHETPQVTPHVEQLLSVMEGELSRPEILARLGLKDRMHFVNSYLKPALDACVIEMTIPDKPRSKNQRYRLTGKGNVKRLGASATPHETLQVTPHLGGEPTKSPTKSDDQVEPVVRLLSLLRAGERSSADLRQALSLKHRGSFRDNYLQPAIERGLVEYTIPGKLSSRLQQYRLTARGRQLLEEAEIKV